MTITIELSPEAEASLLPVAQQKGLSLPQYLQKLANDEAQLAETRRRNTIGRERLKQMEQEDAEYWASLTEAEKEAARADWEDFKKSINEWRMSDRLRFMEEGTAISEPELPRNRHPELQKYFMHWQQIGEIVSEERAHEEEG